MDQAPLPVGSEAYAWRRLAEQLAAHPDLATIVDALNAIDRRQAEEPPCDLRDRSLKDALRLYGLGKAAINSLDETIVADAIEQVAQMICDGNGEYSALETQHPLVQARYRRLSQSCINKFLYVLEREQ